MGGASRRGRAERHDLQKKPLPAGAREQQARRLQPQSEAVARAAPRRMVAPPLKGLAPPRRHEGRGFEGIHECGDLSLGYPVPWLSTHVFFQDPGPGHPLHTAPTV